MSGNKISVSTMNQLIELFKRGAVPKLCKLKLSNTSLNDEAVLPLLLFLEESTQQVVRIDLLFFSHTISYQLCFVVHIICCRHLSHELHL
jgi:hypothetical protein